MEQLKPHQTICLPKETEKDTFHLLIFQAPEINRKIRSTIRKKTLELWNHLTPTPIIFSLKKNIKCLPHKYRESPLFSAKNDAEKFDKNSGKKNLFNLLQEKNCDFNDFGSKNSVPYSKFVGNTNNSGHNKNDSSSNSSYLSYLQKNQKINNQNSELYGDNEKSDNGNNGNQPQIYIQSSPRKFNKNLNEVIIDLSKRCQTSSNSNLTKEKMLKEKSLEKININIMDLKNKHKDPILPKPRNNNEKGLLIGREENFEGKYPYLNGGQTRRSSLNIENEQNKRGISTRPINEALNSSKKERSRSILSEKYLHDE